MGGAAVPVPGGDRVPLRVHKVRGEHGAPGRGRPAVRAPHRQHVPAHPHRARAARPRAAQAAQQAAQREQVHPHRESLRGREREGGSTRE